MDILIKNKSSPTWNTLPGADARKHDHRSITVKGNEPGTIRKASAFRLHMVTADFSGAGSHERISILYYIFSQC